MIECGPHASRAKLTTSVLVNPPTDVELVEFFEMLSRSGIKPSILSNLPEYCKEYNLQIELGVYLNHLHAF